MNLNNDRTEVIEAVIISFQAQSLSLVLFWMEIEETPRMAVKLISD
jgi:hypothetical protein